ncbi:hypothetical protein VTN02DRAFT_5600 [Thermoascus thermophilus]
MDSAMDLAHSAANYAIELAKEHPYRAAATGLGIATLPFGGPATILLNAVGFSATGPVAGSLAAWYQSTFLGGYIPAGSVFSVLQAWSMA